MKRIITFAVAMLFGASANATCSITYKCGTGATGTKPANQTITTGKVFTPSAPGTCAKSGHVFSHWQVSSISNLLNGGGSGTMYDVAWAGTEYTIPYTNVSYTCSNGGSVMLTLTAQWVDASYTSIPTSKSYVDTGLNAKQPKFENLGNNKLMLYSNTTDGATLSRDIVTTLGTNTSATTVPTRGAIVTGINTKQDTLNGAAGWVVENTGTAGSVKQRPVYSTTNNYSTALVEADDLNQIIIDAVNSELTQVANGWQINSSVTLPTLRLYLDASINGTSYCYRRLSGDTGDNGTCNATTLATLGTDGNKSGLWGTVFPYDDIVGKSVCSTASGAIMGDVATAAQNSSLTTEFNAQTGVGTPADTNAKYCWCKMESAGGEPKASSWVYRYTYNDSTKCAVGCAVGCADSVEVYDYFRGPMFDSVQ